MNKPLASTTLIALFLITLCGVARASFQTLAPRLPAGTNAIVAVNVERLAASTYGKSAEWGQRLGEAWAKQPLMIPPGARRLILAADIRPSSFESNWELSLIEMTSVPPLESLARAEGGHIDRVWDKDAVASPINAYFVPLEDNVLASITPAERSLIARWIRQPVKPEGNVASDYIRAALSGLNNQTDIVMAMDLEGAYGVAQIRKWLAGSGIPQIKATDINALATVLGGMEGIRLEIRVDDKINGKAIVDFDRDTSPLRDVAKPIMLEMLNQAGMRIDEAPDWIFATSGKQITMQGKLSDVSVRRLLSIVQSPVPAATEMAVAGGAQGASEPAMASQRYYKAIAAIFANARSGASMAANATWFRTASKRIDQLPILNVDPALVEWGIATSAKLKQTGSLLAVGQTQVDSRVAGVMTPGYASSDYDGAESANFVSSENAAKQRRQAALEEKGPTQQQALAILTEIADTQQRIRADMVAKYNIEF